MKQILALVVAFTITTTAFSQAGQKWSTSGNASTSGDFIGSTNNEPLVFKTNNITRGMFTSAGTFQLSSLTGLGFRLLQTDSSGKLTPFPMSNANEVLFGDGTWRPLPTPPPSTWELNGTSLYYLNGKVGIGTKTPFTNFDVIGDAYISNNLYVGGGIIITEKVNANVEVVTSKLKADTIVMDSTKGIYGYSIFKDRVKLENKLEVVGNTQINGDFRVNGDFIFGNNKRIGYLPPSNGDPEIISFGGSPIGLGTFCTLPTVTVPTINQFGAMIQIYGKSDYSPTGNMNVLNIGYDGANGIIDMRGQYTDGSDSKLLINWYCGQDVAINANPAKGGNVTMTSSTTGMVGIGITPTAKLDVLGTFKLRDGSQGANKILMSDADGLASWQTLLIDDGDWTINGADIYRLTGNVGIGATDTYKMLTVNGDVSLANYNNSGGGNTGNGMSGLEILGMNQVPTRRGISLDPDPNGSFNFFINSNQTTSSFNFKNGNGTPTTLMTIMGDGNVGIGTNNPQAKLEVSTDATQGGKSIAVKDNVSGMDVFRVMNNGNIFATELTIKLKEQFPDYVFAKDYQLLPLNELGLFISKNNHLPNIPTANEVEKNGLSVGEMQAKQMEKIEELTLYILELNKRLSSLEKENKNLKENK